MAALHQAVDRAGGDATAHCVGLDPRLTLGLATLHHVALDGQASVFLWGLPLKCDRLAVHVAHFQRSYRSCWNLCKTASDRRIVSAGQLLSKVEKLFNPGNTTLNIFKPLNRSITSSEPTPH